MSREFGKKDKDSWTTGFRAGNNRLEKYIGA